MHKLENIETWASPAIGAFVRFSGAPPLVTGQNHFGFLCQGKSGFKEYQETMCERIICEMQKSVPSTEQLLQGYAIDHNTQLAIKPQLFEGNPLF